MKPMITLIIFIKRVFKIRFSNLECFNNRSLFLCHDIWVNRMHFIQKGLPLKPIICAMEKEVNGRLDALTTATLQRVYRILEVVFNFVFFQMT